MAVNDRCGQGGDMIRKSGSLLLAVAFLAGAGVSLWGDGAAGMAQAAQAVATFRVGIRIVPVSTAAKTAPRLPAPTAAISAVGPDALPSARGEGRAIVVQPGETLSLIAAREYGDAGRYMDIFDANRDVLSSPDVVPAGTRLRLP